MVNIDGGIKWMLPDWSATRISALIRLLPSSCKREAEFAAASREMQ